MECSNNIHPHLYGSCRGTGTQDCAFSRVLCHQLSRLSHKTLIVGDTDAKSCFDHLTGMLAILIMRSSGMEKQPGQVTFSTLTQASYTIKTMYRISQESYRWEDNRQVHGPRQGSTIGSTLCLIIFSILFSIMAKQSDQVEFSCPSQLPYNRHNQDGVVDHVTIMATTDHASGKEAITRLYSKWANILYISGGLLELPKCSFYIMNWKLNLHGAATLDH
jgi:hypothetical protein